MHFSVDLNKCQDHGQCVFAAPKIFHLDPAGRLGFRSVSDGEYTAEADEADRDDIELAADMCPVQAIYVRD